MKTSNKLNKNLNLMKTVAAVKSSKLRKQCLKDLTNKKELCDCLSEICFNIAKGNIQLDSSHKKQIKKHKDLIYLFAKKDKNRVKKLNQVGGFLPYLIPIIATLAADLISSKLRK